MVSRATTGIPWALLGEVSQSSPAATEQVDLGVLDAWSGLPAGGVSLDSSGQGPSTVEAAPRSHWSLPAGMGLLSGGLVLLFAAFFVLVVTERRVAVPGIRRRDE